MVRITHNGKEIKEIKKIILSDDTKKLILAEIP